VRITTCASSSFMAAAIRAGVVAIIDLDDRTGNCWSKQANDCMGPDQACQLGHQHHDQHTPSVCLRDPLKHTQAWWTFINLSIAPAGL
jgi:hypothetical protein